MKRLLTHQAIFDMNQAIRNTKFEGRVSSVFRYSLRKNLEVTQAEVDNMIEAFKPEQEFLDYRKELATLASEYGVQNIDDIANFDKTIKALPDDKNAEFTRRQTDLADKYKNAIEQQQLADKELQDFLKEKVEIDISMVPAEQCPELPDGDLGFIIYGNLFPMFIPPKEPDNIKDQVPYEL